MQTRDSVCAVLALGIALAAPAAAQAQLIGVYADLVGSHCQILADPYVPTNFYISTRATAQLVPPGVNGAEFQVTHDLNSGEAVLTATANPAANVALGDPMAGGCNIAFPVCQSEPDINNLYTVQIVLLTAVQNRILQVAAHDTPSNPNFNCALINMCDGPIFTALCVSPGFGCINDHVGACIWDPVEAVTWSQVKGLFH